MEIKDKIKNLIKEALKNLEIEEVDFVVEHPADLKMGDYSTSIALALSKNLKTNPKELAEKIVATLRQAQGEFPEIQEIQVAGAGFINFYLSKEFFDKSTEKITKDDNFGKNNSLAGQKILVEHTDPNPFKEFHVGHLMPNVIGSTIARILEWIGGEVKQSCYQGDVGLHVARAVWGYVSQKDWKTAYVYG